MPATVHAPLCAALCPAAWPVPRRAPAADPAPPVLAPEKNPCSARADPVAIGSAQWNGWGRDLDNTRYQPEPAIRAIDVPKLALKWAFGYQSGTEFGQPTVVDGRLFVTQFRRQRFTALDAKTGCTYWTFDAPAGSRTAIFIGELGLVKRARAAEEVETHAGASRRHQGAERRVLRRRHRRRVCARRAEGHVAVEDRRSIRIHWRASWARRRCTTTACTSRLPRRKTKWREIPATAAAPFAAASRRSTSAAGGSSGRATPCSRNRSPRARTARACRNSAPRAPPSSPSPTIDPKRNVLYVATGGSATGLEQSLTDAVAAFDLSDGKLRWVKQLNVRGEAASSGFLSSPVLRTLSTGNEIILAGQMSGVVYGLDPDHGGEILWQTRIGAAAAAAGAVPGPGAGRRRRHRVGRVGRPPQFLCGPVRLLAQPVNASGSLTALDMKTGVVRWSTPAPQPACAWSERLLARAVASGHGDAGRRILGIDGRPLARLLDHRRQDSLGLRHGESISNQERRSRQRRCVWIMAARPSSTAAFTSTRAMPCWPFPSTANRTQ